ncbi:MAG: P-II family nitrogen regulator, partial [Rhodospirillaceae bacterium]|nr:P-II family nitrogen regulator [Rhodospirillaceae bacterium]
LGPQKEIPAMRMKLIVVLAPDDKTDTIIDAAREGGATGATVITSVRGEGLKPEKTFLGLEITAKRDVLLFLVVEERSQEILERIRDVGRFDEEPGAGVAFQIAIEDVVGLTTQLPIMMKEVEDDL